MDTIPPEKNIKNKIILIAIIVIVVIVAIIVVVKIRQKSSVVTSTMQVIPAGVSAFDVDLSKIDFNAPVDPASSSDISATEKKAIYIALLSGYKIMASKDVKAIRAYMTAKASSLAEKTLVTNKTDADLISLSQHMLQTMVMPTPDQMLMPSSVWIKDANSVIIIYSDRNTGTTTKKVVNINGQWY